MAREEELKRIDLKVNVSCCEGCRRKVMKAMSLKGVLRTEIQPSHDRVTVVGDVDARVLVKKLAKVGKIAEVVAPPPASASDEHKVRRDDGGNKDGDRAPAEERSRGKDADGKSGVTGDKAAKQGCKKCAHEAAAHGDGSGDRAGNGKAAPPSKDAAAPPKGREEGGGGFGAGSFAQDHATAGQGQVQQHYHRAEPPMVVPVHVPYYAPTAAPYYGYYGMPPPPPMAMPPMAMGVVPRRPPQMVRPQPSRFDEDYFNDDNTVGCSVM